MENHYTVVAGLLSLYQMHFYHHICIAEHRTVEDVSDLNGFCQSLAEFYPMLPLCPAQDTHTHCRIHLEQFNHKLTSFLILAAMWVVLPPTIRLKLLVDVAASIL